MTTKERNTKLSVAEAVAGDRDLIKALMKEALQEVLEGEMTEFLGAEPGERTESRSGYRAGYYGRSLVTRIGKLELRVPRDRSGEFSTALFERYARSEKALVAALAEMYVQGVSTRKVKAITEELCGHSFSASSISAINKGLDEALAKFANRPLDEAYPYLILDARYERVRDNGVIAHQAVLIAIGINWEGKRQVLAVEMANRESQSSWKDFLLRLKERGLSGVEFVVSDDHAGLKKAISVVLTDAAWQRCYVHFLRNALDYLPRKADDDCLQELRWIYDRRDIQEAQQDLSAWIGKWQAKYPKLVDWVETNIIETLTFYRLPRAHHKHLKSTNLLERLNEAEAAVRTLIRWAGDDPDREGLVDDLLRCVDELLHDTPRHGWWRARRRVPEGPRRRAGGSRCASPRLGDEALVDVPEDAGDDAAHDRADDRDPGVRPVRAALAGDREQLVDDARAEVAGRVDRVPGGAAEAHADRPHEDRDRERADRRGVRAEGQDHEHEDEGPDDLGDEVEGGVADGRAGAEDGELEARIVGLGPVRPVVQGDQEGAEHRADELTDEIGRDLVDGHAALGQEAKGDRRVQVGAGERRGHDDAAEDREGPRSGDDDPARVLRLGLGEQHARDDAVAEQDQDHGSEDLTEEDLHIHS